jgi:hypothetical protein
MAVAVFKKGVYEFTVFINKSRKGLFQDALFAFGGMMVRQILCEVSVLRWRKPNISDALFGISDKTRL